MIRRCYICGDQFDPPTENERACEQCHTLAMVRCAPDRNAPPFPTNPAERVALGITETAPQPRESSTLLVPGLRTAVAILAVLVLLVLFAGDPDLHDALIARLTAETCR